MTHVAHGIIHGKTIELTEDLGLQPGQAVIVQLDPAPSEPRTWGDGIRASAGIAADIPGIEEAWLEVERYRKSGANRDLPE
jgi:hypothetical protein